MDTLSPEARSALMAKIQNKNTKAEIIVRSCIHRLGYRFRLHYSHLPGSPDIVLPKLNTVIFVHGCFWHRHENCKCAYLPKSNTDFWTEKFRKNVERDKRAQNAFKKLGWNVAVVWECETKDLGDLIEKLKYFLSVSTFRSSSSAMNTTNQHQLRGPK